MWLDWSFAYSIMPIFIVAFMLFALGAGCKKMFPNKLGVFLQNFFAILGAPFFLVGAFSIPCNMVGFPLVPWIVSLFV